MTEPDARERPNPPARTKAAGSKAVPLAIRRPWWAKLIYSFCRRLSVGLIGLFYRLRVENLAAVPPTGPVLIIANHQSHLDPPAIGGRVTSRQLTFLARGGLFKFKPFGMLISALNSIPLKEDGNDKAAIAAIIDGLSHGQAVMVFPEGSRTPDGSVHEFKRGALLIARRAKCPVLPAAIEGAFDAWPRSRPLPRLFGKRVAVRYGEVIPSEQFLDHDDPLDAVARQIDAMRLELRASLRSRSRGKYPAPGPGDAPSFTPSTPAEHQDQTPSHAESPARNEPSETAP